MADEWGPWIEHDGAQPSFREGDKIRLRWLLRPGLIAPSSGPMDCNTYPGFFWRWKTVQTGLFTRERLRICDDPAFAPIVAYRIRRPDALRRLIDIAADPENGLPPRFPVEELA